MLGCEADDLELELELQVAFGRVESFRKLGAAALN